METEPTVIDQLRRAIVTSDFSQNEIALGAGVPQPTVNRFVNGLQPLGADHIAKLCRFLRLELRPKKGRKKISEKSG